MKKYTGWIWAGIIVLALIFIWPSAWPSIPGFNFDFGSGDDTEELMERHTHEVDSLKNVIQMYAEDAADLNKEITSLNGQISDLQYTIRRRENTIANLKKETNEKVTTVSKFNSTDIYKFLSDRYKTADTSATK